MAQRERATSVNELVEPVLRTVGGLCQATDTVDLRRASHTLEPAGRVRGDQAGAVAVEGLQGGDLARVTHDDLLADLLLEAQHHILHLRLEDVDDREVTLVGSLFDRAQHDRLSEVRVLELRSLERIGDGHADRLEAVAELGDGAVVTEDDRLVNAQATGHLDEVAVVLDGADQGVSDEGVIDELVTQQLQRGRNDRLGSHSRPPLK